MSARKLSQQDKQEILNLYRQTPETTSTLASRYGVSSSTISRFLKSSLPEEEYEVLIQQKRIARPHGNVAEAIPELVSEPIDTPTEPASDISASTPTANSRRVRRRSSAPETPATTQPPVPVLKRNVGPHNADLLSESIEPEEIEQGEELEENLAAQFDRAKVTVLQEMLEEDLADLNEDDDDLDDDDIDDEWEEDIDAAGERSPGRGLFTQSQLKVQVLPLSEASLPRTCYVVIDRAAELIARPLRDFSDLGQISPEEVQEKTLPVFDNHRVARRFSNRSQRVIKVPDGRMFQKTLSHLQAKGITRLLIDGQIYSLS